MIIPVFIYNLRYNYPTTVNEHVSVNINKNVKIVKNNKIKIFITLKRTNKIRSEITFSLLYTPKFPQVRETRLFKD